MQLFKHLLPGFLLLFICALSVAAQQPERKVENPIAAAEAQRRAQRQTDPQKITIVAPATPTAAEELELVADSQEGQGEVVIATGNVQAKYGDTLIIADRATFNKVTNDVLAEGNVFFEQQGQRLTGERIEFNYKTRRGTIYTLTAFTNRTPDGTVLVVDADRADKTGADVYNLRNAKLTACQERVPKWVFTAKRARIRLDHRAKIYNALLRVKNVPVFYLPYASVSISKQDRATGLLIPSSGSSTLKGRTLHLAYFQTLGRSADILFRSDVYTKRGIGLGFDFRARTDEQSRINFGSFVVFDRVIGEKRDPAGNELPKQSGSSFYADAVQYFKNGFVAVADVNITSSFEFRQVFSDNIATAISPEERSIFYINKNWRSFSFNSFFGEQSSFIADIGSDGSFRADKIVKVRQLPSVELTQRSTKVSESLPFYFSFGAALEGVRRSETSTYRVSDLASPDLKTPSIVQRLDFSPRAIFPLRTFAGFTITPSVGVRSTFYSDSLNPETRQVIGQNLLRNYADVQVDVRAPALAKVFHHRNSTPWFKHIIEPFVEYRRVAGIDDFNRTLRVDERDVIAETNEVAYGVSNSFLVRRQRVGDAAPQPHELFNLTLTQKYFFDPTFGGALREGVRNQFFPINTLSGFSFGGVQRSLSPLNVRARYRPNTTTFADVRLNYDTRFHDLRDLIVGYGFTKGRISISQSWYYTRLVAVDKFREEERRFDPSSFPGNQLDIAVFAGNSLRGPYGGFVLTKDLRDRTFNGQPRDNRFFILSSSAGWAWDCCSVNVQSVTFNAGVRNESRVIFAFTLKGLGSFGTESIGQRRP